MWLKQTGAMCMNIQILFWLRMNILLLQFIIADEYAFFWPTFI